MIKKVFFL